MFYHWLAVGWPVSCPSAKRNCDSDRFCSFSSRRASECCVNWKDISKSQPLSFNCPPIGLVLGLTVYLCMWTLFHSSHSEVHRPLWWSRWNLSVAMNVFVLINIPPGTSWANSLNNERDTPGTYVWRWESRRQTFSLSFWMWGGGISWAEGCS